MAYRYTGNMDGVECWDGHVVVVEREGDPEPHPEDLWHWHVEHPPTCPKADFLLYGALEVNACTFGVDDPSWGEDWPPGLPKIDGVVHAAGTRLDVYSHWELGDEVDFWWIVGPEIERR